MEDYDREHPCVAPAVRGWRWITATTAMARYAACKGVRLVKSITSLDLVEAITASTELLVHAAPSNPDVDSLATLINFYRQRLNSHVVTVGHSEGTIIDAQAIRELSVPPGHTLAEANRCIGALALAPATPKNSYHLDQYHLYGLLANGDVIEHVADPTDWERVEAPLSSKVRAARNLFEAIYWEIRVHDVETSYLTGSNLTTAIDRIEQLDRECVPASAEFSLSESVAPLGSTVTGALSLLNQNGRPILGRSVPIVGPVVQVGDSLLFRAAFPSDSLQWVRAVVTPDLVASAAIQIPLAIADATITEDHSSHWEFYSSTDGGHVGTQAPPPTEIWDGAGACPRIVTIDEGNGASISYRLRCIRGYHLHFTLPVALPGGATATSARTYWISSTGITDSGSPVTSSQNEDRLCFDDNLRCFTGAYIELLNDNGHAYARSPIVPTP